MEIHGLTQGFSFCDPASFRDYNQQLSQNAALQNQLAQFKRSRDALTLKLEADPIPECLETFLENGGHSPLLGSPEMNLLKLGSPELEKLIMTQPNEEGCPASSYKNPNTHSTKSSTNSKYSKNAISPLISVDDLQFITETNQALESILPRSYTGSQIEPENRSSVAYEIDNFLEPLQQVPESHISDPALKVNRKRSISQRSNQQTYTKPRNLNASGQREKPREAFQTDSNSQTLGENFDKSEGDSIFERFSNNEQLYENNTAFLYDVNQPTMVSNQFRQPPNTGLEKEQNSAFSLLPLPPIDLEVQEIVKRERKKLKNRVAASKCRKKKLEREAQLEVRVQHLKDKNIELNALANALRQQATELKQRIMEHINSGCHTRLVHY